MLNPMNHTRTDHEVKRYAGEPYVMAADVYTAAPKEGHAGWTWYTGASGWMYQAGIEWILGIRRRGDFFILIHVFQATGRDFRLPTVLERLLTTLMLKMGLVGRWKTF